MDVGLIFSGGGTTMQQMVDLSVEAEKAGIDSIYMSEAWRSGFVGLAAIAAATERVRIGPYILNAYARSPWITGMSAIDLDELSGGRLLLGVGSGNKHINGVWQGIPQERPLKKMEEYVTLLKEIVSTPLGGTVKFDGEMHAMDWPPAVQPFRPSIPVYLSAVFPKMTAVAARVADGLALGALMSPGYIRDVIRPRAEAAAADAGRDPAELGFITAPFVSVDDDAEVARQAAREAICHLYHPLPHPYYDFALREHGFSAAADAATKYVPEGNMAKALEAMDDRVIDAVTISGTLEDCAAKLAAYEGVVDETVFVNVNYSAESVEGLLDNFRNLIALGSRVSNVSAAAE